MIAARRGARLLASDRSRVVAIVGLLCAVVPALALASDTATPRLATLDWGIAQNLTAMGAAPVAVGQIAGYATWVGGPPLPSATHELGLRSEPNMEILAQLDPDRILITRMYASQKARLSQVAPVATVDVYFTPGGVWHNTVAAVRKLGRIAHRPGAARALIARTRRHIHQAASRLSANTPPPLLIVQFVDARHVRVYGTRSLVQATLRRMGLRNAWQGATTRWGMAVVPLERLAGIERGRVVVMDPVPVGVAPKVADSRVWRSLPVVNNAPVLRIPAVWSFGGLPSASRFARLLAGALEHAPASGPGWPQDSARHS